MEFDFISELIRISISIFIASNLVYFISKFIVWLCNVTIGVLYVKD